MLWLIFLILTTISWAVYDLFFKAIENDMNFFLALLLIGIFQVVLALPFVVYDSYNGTLEYTTKGQIISAVMGILLGLGTIFFFYAFKYGANVSVAIPFYGVGALLIGAIGGVLIFKETINLKIAIGFVFGILSMILLTIES